MQKISKHLVVIALSSSLLVGCATTYEESGALTGAIAGAAVGSTVGRGPGQMFAIWLGAVVGSQVGATIGRHMDEHDRDRLVSVLETHRTASASTWVNPDTGYNYTATPTRTYEEPGGIGPCREFTIDASIGGKTEQIYGTACRQADGSWKVIK